MELPYDSHQATQSLINEIKKAKGIGIAEFPLDYGPGKKYSFLRFSSKGINRDSKVMMIGAGIHANEVSGILTWISKGKEVFEYAREKGVGLIVYPLRNPSGLEKVAGYPDRDSNHRYNILNDRGDKGTGNNDFLRYKIDDKEELVDDLGKSREFVSWSWASDCGIRLPLETNLMHRIIKEDLKIGARILGALDMHQDLITEDVGKGTYYYRMEVDPTPYLPILQKIESAGVPLLRNFAMSAGFASGEAIVSDETGGIIRYDGTWPDLMAKLGSRYSVTAETTGATPLELAVEVNFLWAKGLIDLVSVG